MKAVLPMGDYKRSTQTTVDTAKVQISHGQVRMGKVILFENRLSRGGPPYNRANHRIREIEKIIRARYGGPVPETDDAEAYVEAIAHAYAVQKPESALKALRAWCGTWAPWALVDGTLEAAIANTEGRTYDLSQFKVAHLLAVRWKERQRLGLRTIAAFDVTRKDQKRLAKEKKRNADRERARAKRARSGVQSRTEYLSEFANVLKPWELENISRATWYRRNKERETGSVANR